MQHQNAVEKSLQRCFTSKPQPIPLPININPMESVLKPKSDQIQLTLTPIPGECRIFIVTSLGSN